ncbi:leucine-rich repeat protein soc-2 homolog [Ruditapes philippinarum]|uniref:leucine-rich repeat protein soc-2 homolog n=1 Tax=Ruditapes philippinarum TaxID=129788 RepID=UPI00295AF3C4|nr:leucine-rich repeat protein soc-2 homolog [Ruditapes philippinarum]
MIVKEVLLFLLISGVPKVHSANYDRDRDCPAKGVSHPCSCTPVAIDCINRAIVGIPPAFTKTNWVFEKVDLSQNLLTRIPARAFQYVNVSKIILSNNNISSIEPDAFQPLQDQIKVLDLRNNKLTFLPEVLGKLHSLNVLDVSYNPIQYMNFTDNVMRELGDFINEFHFGDDNLKGWPESIHHLQMLRILKFYGGSNEMDRIPITAFKGFEWTLEKLWMQNTQLIAVPIALQDLKSTNELHFDNNVHVGDAGILIPAFAGLTDKLEVMSLENNSLTTFPSVLLTLRQLHNLSLARNNLQFVSDQAVSVVGSNLTTVNLQACGLDRIPGALSKLEGIIDLDFSNNKITTIEKNDLQRMVNLQRLDMSENPLQYISRSTFYDLKRLQNLTLQETELYLVPYAITNIPTLKTLDLTSSDTYIECNCDLNWLYCYTTHNNTGLTIIGDCETIQMGIDRYARTRIPSVCPKIC